MSRLDSLILAFLSRFGVDPAVGDLAVGDSPDVARTCVGCRGTSPPYRAPIAAWGVAELPVPAAGRRKAPPAEETAVDRRRPRRSRRRPRSRRRLEATAMPRPRGLVI